MKKCFVFSVAPMQGTPIGGLDAALCGIPPGGIPISHP